MKLKEELKKVAEIIGLTVLYGLFWFGAAILFLLFLGPVEQATHWALYDLGYPEEVAFFLVDIAMIVAVWLLWRITTEITIDAIKVINWLVNKFGGAKK